MGFSNTKANRVILGILFVCVLYLHRDSPSFVNAKAADAAAVAAFVKLFAAGGKNITYAQVVKWFDEQRAATRGDTFKFSPRLWPFCVTSAQIRNKSMTSPDSKIYQFRRIIQSLELSKTYFYQFNKTIHSSLEEKKWVLNVSYRFVKRLLLLLIIINSLITYYLILLISHSFNHLIFGFIKYISILLFFFETRWI